MYSLRMAHVSQGHPTEMMIATSGIQHDITLWEPISPYDLVLPS